ncbi:hypothetical protein [Paenibacillus sp. FSL H7-0331]|uniref:hypothetical protein n=1 Tax=Paenibacillus sp. FSL H7-0331 TaxID=1920421 RepID=UPI00117F024B|nr:hypothetical protein [Paenibacillus sp. FSL H7-0331]
MSSTFSIVTINSLSVASAGTETVTSSPKLTLPVLPACSVNLPSVEITVPSLGDVGGVEWLLLPPPPPLLFLDARFTATV